jgi:hypothetical protein
MNKDTAGADIRARIDNARGFGDDRDRVVTGPRPRLERGYPKPQPSWDMVDIQGHGHARFRGLAVFTIGLLQYCDVITGLSRCFVRSREPALSGHA